MTDEEIMARIVQAFHPVYPGQSDNPADKTMLRVKVWYQQSSTSGAGPIPPSKVQLQAVLTHPCGRVVGFGKTVRDAMIALLSEIGREPLTMAQHDALQALRVEVGL